jgi:hypothetical protein
MLSWLRDALGIVIEDKLSPQSDDGEGKGN